MVYLKDSHPLEYALPWRAPDLHACGTDCRMPEYGESSAPTGAYEALLKTAASPPPGGVRYSFDPLTRYA